MRKLRINEDFDSTTSIGTELDNPVTDSDSVVYDYDDVYTDTDAGGYYDSLEKLGFIMLLASNDIHTIHVNACGTNFTRLHLEADDIYNKLNEYGDQWLEMCCEDGHFISSINNSKELVGWDDYDVAHGFTLVDGVRMIAEIMNKVVQSICGIYDSVESDVQSVLDEWIRYMDSKMNYFLGRMLQEAKKRTKNESMMNRSTRRRKTVCEHLDNLKLGQSYTLFCQVEDHIDDYNCDTTSLKKGDYIIRDFQFGHLPNGGNKGYIPYKVVDIEYDRDEDNGCYWDARKRLHLFDGHEDFYIECYNERFNGMFHKLKKSSVKEDN